MCVMRELAYEASKKLVTYLAKSQIPLTVCPVSNMLLKISPSMNKHTI